MSGKVDWDEIKAEYIAGGVSQRALAEEHGVSYKTLRERAVKEKWTELRRKTGEKTAQKLTEAITDAKIKKIEKLVEELIRQSMTAARQNTKRPKTIRETEELADGRVIVTVRTEYEEVNVVDKQGLRLLAQTVKDLDEILRRQRQEAAGGEDTNAIVVRFETPSGADYSV